MATSVQSNNRIPLQVSHGTGPSNTTNYQTTYEFRTSNGNLNQPTTTTTTTTTTGGINGAVPPSATSTSAYDMRDINGETDRIKQRMKEFEDRCKKWREEFFTNSPGKDFDQRVPFGNNNNTINIDNNFAFNNAANSTNVNSSSGGCPSGFTHTSTIHHQHKTSLEDTPNGGKKYKIEFDIGDFKQNELQISTHGSSTLVVKGDRELKAGLATETKTFNREITLPDYVDASKMNAYLLDSAQNSSGSSSSPDNVLIVEAPVIMEKYSYRRSAYDSSQSPIRISNSTSARTSPTKQFNPPPPITTIGSSSLLRNAGSSGTSPNIAAGSTLSSSSTSHQHQHHHHHQHSSSENKSSTTTTTKILREPSADDLNNNRIVTSPSHLRASRSNLSNQALAPELIKGYPMYDSGESCVIYKFDLTGFDQSEIQLTITVERTLEIKATKETQDHLGKIYREFKREIHLEPDVDLNAIKNVLHEGLLTLKIPKQTRPDGMGSMSNSHNLHAPNGFKELYTDDGKLIKLTSDFRGYSPENVKIVLSANNVLKVTAAQSEPSPGGSKGTVQKECTRHYTLPSWVQPENMKAIMSRDGILNVDIRA